MEAALEFLRDNPGAWGLVVTYAAAGLEYLLPPLPADSVVLAGSLLVVAGIQPMWLVFTVAVLGGATGAAVHYFLGGWRLRPDGPVRDRVWVERMTGKGSLERFFEKLRRYGLWLIAFNRAFPGVRAVTFFAAGMARMKFVPVMAAGLVSNVLWTALVLGLGVSVGGNWEKIQEVFGVYKTALYIAGATGLVLWLVYRQVKKRRQRNSDDSQ